MVFVAARGKGRLFAFLWHFLRMKPMSTMIKEVYIALIDAGTEEGKATAAAEAVADFQSEISKVHHEMAEIKADIKVLKWMVGLVIAVNLIPLLRDLLS